MHEDTGINNHCTTGICRSQLCSILLILFLILSVKSSGQDADHWETIFYANSTFRYFTSSEGIPDPGWRNLEFNDAPWRMGEGGIGYGDNDDGTSVENCISLCIRKNFTILDTTIITGAALHIDYDDAFVAYLNGTEIARSSGLTGDLPAYNQVSTSNHEAVMYAGGDPEGYIIDKKALSGLLIEGDNILAIQVHNTGINSSDLSSNIFLSVGLADNDTHYLSTPPWFEPPKSLWNSSLPIIIIETNGQAIPNEPKIDATMKIISVEDGEVNTPENAPNEYDGPIAIEVRGATSSGYPQKPYALETRNHLGENYNVPLLGMPSENDWVLISHYNEKTFMRNLLSFHLFEQMGHYATRMKLVQVILNGNYQGIYLFGEKIKRDRFRVNISEITPRNNSGDSLTGGYIFKTEYYSNQNTWLSDYSPIDHPSYSTHFAYYYPKYDEITDQQKNYLKEAVDQFQFVLQQPDFAGQYQNYIDIPSFIDYFLISELSRNIDGYKKSRYFYKDRDQLGGKIYAGPVWDFDWAWKNISSCLFKTTDCSGWAYKLNDCQSTPSPGWMVRLLEDPNFQDMLKCRWTNLRATILSEEYMNHFMDSIYSTVVNAQVSHFTRWPVLGVRTGAPEIEAPALTYDEEVDRLRSWVGKRLAWLDDNMPGTAGNCIVTSTTGNLNSEPLFRMFPNPATSDLYIESDEALNEITLYDLSGNVIEYFSPGYTYSWHTNIDHLLPGVYMVRIITKPGSVLTSKLLIH